MLNMGDLIIVQYVRRPQADDNIDQMHLPEEQSEVSTRPDHLYNDIENNRWAVEESENCKN